MGEILNYSIQLWMVLFLTLPIWLVTYKLFKKKKSITIKGSDLTLVIERGNKRGGASV